MFFMLKDADFIPYNVPLHVAVSLLFVCLFDHILLKKRTVAELILALFKDMTVS